MTDQDDGAIFAREFQRFQMNFGNQRAGCVNHAQLAQPRLFARGRRNSVRAEHQHRAQRHFLHGLNENGAALAELFHHVTVMHDFVMHVHRRPVGLQRQLHNVHRAHHPGAKTARPHANQAFAVCTTIY